MHQPALLSLLLLTALLLLSATASDPHENIRFEYCQQGTSYTAAPRHLQPAFSHGRALARLLCFPVGIQAAPPTVVTIHKVQAKPKITAGEAVQFGWYFTLRT